MDPLFEGVGCPCSCIRVAGARRFFARPQEWLTRHSRAYTLFDQEAIMIAKKKRRRNPTPEERECEDAVVRFFLAEAEKVFGPAMGPDESVAWLKAEIRRDRIEARAEARAEKERARFDKRGARRE